MAIGTPVQLCLTENSNSGTHVSTGIDCPVGSLIVVAVSTWAGLNGTVTSVSDSAGNTYNLAVQNAATASIPYPCAIYYCLNSTVDLPNGGWIAAVNSGAVNQGLGAWSVSGANGGLDKTNTSSSTGSTSASLSTGTLTVANEIVFGLTTTSGSLSGFSNTSGFTELAFGVTGSQNAFGFGYKIVAATTSVTYSASWTTSNHNAEAIASFEATSSSVFNWPPFQLKAY